MPRTGSRSMWSGSISFGLVNIPVKLFVAIREKNIHFHMLHDQDHARLQRKMVCSADGKEVHPEHIVKGYEVAPDQYVIVRDRELEALVPKASRTIEIQDFVDLEDIDPLYYDRPYYLAPGEHAAKSYKLLVEAMVKSKKVAIATFVMRQKEYLAALRPVNGVICLTTMHFNDEVLPAKEVAGVSDVKVDDREVKMAQHLVDQLSADFKPSKYHDDYQERVMELIEKKAKGEQIVTQPAVAEKPHRVVNLMAALEQSLADAKKKKVRNGHPGHETTRRRRKVA
ncbi:Ku protein [soil metagenome]